MVVAGRSSTIPATLEQMVYHGEIVARAATRAMVVVDLPFPFQHLGVRTAVEACARILKETGCQAVKLEGTAGQADVVAGIVAAGIPVMAHVGLRPQAVHQLGGDDDVNQQQDKGRQPEGRGTHHSGACFLDLGHRFFSCSSRVTCLFSTSTNSYAIRASPCAAATICLANASLLIEEAARFRAASWTLSKLLILPSLVSERGSSA
jgi:hypothetical protein